MDLGTITTYDEKLEAKIEEDMKVEQYKPNSHKYREEQAKKAAKSEKPKSVNKVVKNKVTVKKDTVASSFLKKDIPKIRDYALHEILFPAIKNAIYNVINGSLSIALFGETKSSKTRSNAGYVSYRDYGDRMYSDRRRDDIMERRASRFDFDNIIIETRAEAEDVLSQMDDLIERFGEVTVGDLNDMLGISGEYTDNNYGWRNIRFAETVRVKDGWILKLPKVKCLK